MWKFRCKQNKRIKKHFIEWIAHTYTHTSGTNDGLILCELSNLNSLISQIAHFQYSIEGGMVRSLELVGMSFINCFKSLYFFKIKKLSNLLNFWNVWSLFDWHYLVPSELNFSKKSFLICFEFAPALKEDKNDFKWEE